MILANPLLWLLIVLVAPVGGGLLSLVAGARGSELAARTAALATVVGAAVLLGLEAQGTWGSYLGLDVLSDLFLFVVAATYASSTWFSRGYLRGVHRPFLTPQRYYALLGAFAFAMLLTLSVTDLGLMWIGLEATTVAGALLIVLERTPMSVEAAWRFTLIASAGLTIALFSLLLLYESTGSLDAFALAAHPLAVTLPIAMVVTLALVGYGTKIGLFPMHTWLPDAYTAAPSPVSALFSGALLPTALYTFLRVYAVVATPVPVALSDLIIVFGVVTAVVAAFLMQRQRSYKRLLAYSSMEVMGLVIVGVGLGGIALYGALVLVIAHSFAKSASFYCAGNVLRKTGTTRMDEVRGLRTDLPWTGATWVLSAVAVTGTPPFGTFVGELLILTGAIVLGVWWVAIACLVAMLVAFLGMNAQIGRMVFGTEARTFDPGPSVPKEHVGAVAIPLINVGVALALGVAAIPYLAPAIRAAALALGGTVP